MGMNVFKEIPPELTSWLIKLKESPFINIIVHNNIFHADDVLCCAIIEEYYGNKQYNITRSGRTVKELNNIPEKHFVLDMSCKEMFENNTLWLDHHQKESGKYPNGVKYAACGKVFQVLYFGILTPIQMEYVRSRLLYPIEASDNGQRFDFLRENKMSWIREMNKLYEGTEVGLQSAFELSVINAKVIFHRILAESKMYEEQKPMFERSVEESIIKPRLNNLLLFRENINWKEFYFESEPPIYFVITKHDNFYRINTIPISPISNVPKYSLPKIWWALNAESLFLATGISGAIYCHPSGLYADWEKLENVIDAAQLAIAELNSK